MRSTRRRSPFLSGNRIVVLLTATVVVVGLTGVTAMAMAGSGAATVAKKKKKKKKICPPGTTRVVVKKKNKRTGKKIKKVTCVANTPPSPTPPAATAALTISPDSHFFGTVNRPCNAACPTQAFTLTNTGSGVSGAPSVSITLVTDPTGDPPGTNPPAFVVEANTCTASLPPGGSCSVTVKFDPDDPQSGYVSTLDVGASPGGTVHATLTGNGT